MQSDVGAEMADHRSLDSEPHVEPAERYSNNAVKHHGIGNDYGVQSRGACGGKLRQESKSETVQSPRTPFLGVDHLTGKADPRVDIFQAVC